MWFLKTLLLIGIFRPLTFKMIIDSVGLISTTYLPSVTLFVDFSHPFWVFSDLVEHST